MKKNIWIIVILIIVLIAIITLFTTVYLYDKSWEKKLTTVKIENVRCYVRENVDYGEKDELCVYFEATNIGDKPVTIGSDFLLKIKRIGKNEFIFGSSSKQTKQIYAPGDSLGNFESCATDYKEEFGDSFIIIFIQSERVSEYMSRGIGRKEVYYGSIYECEER